MNIVRLNAARLFRNARSALAMKNAAMLCMTLFFVVADGLVRADDGDSPLAPPCKMGPTG